MLGSQCSMPVQLACEKKFGDTAAGGCALWKRQLGAMLEYNEPFTTVTLCCDACAELEKKDERGLSLMGRI